MERLKGEPVSVQSFGTRVFGYGGMGNRRWFKIECLLVVSNHESKRLKVAALNLFHPIGSPFSRKNRAIIQMGIFRLTILNFV